MYHAKNWRPKETWVGGLYTTEQLLQDVARTEIAAREFEAAKAIINLISFPEWKANTIAALAIGYAEAGEFDTAREIIKTLEVQHRIIVLNCIATVSRDRNLFQQIFRQVFDIARDPASVPPAGSGPVFDYLFLAIAEAEINTGFFDDAALAVREIKFPAFTGNSPGCPISGGPFSTNMTYHLTVAPVTLN
jgi:hypothetical protein